MRWDSCVPEFQCLVVLVEDWKPVPWQASHWILMPGTETVGSVLKSAAVLPASRAHCAAVVKVAGMLTVGFGTTAVAVAFAVFIVVPSW
jgi:hypothetical protein